MQFTIKRDILLKSLNFVQGVVEKKNTLPILSNVLLELKNKKLSVIATDLDIVFYDEINEVKVTTETDNEGANRQLKSWGFEQRGTFQFYGKEMVLYVLNLPTCERLSPFDWTALQAVANFQSTLPDTV